MSNVIGLQPDRQTYTVTKLHRSLGAEDKAKAKETMAEAWAVLNEALARSGSGARIHVKIEVERPG